MLLLLTLPFVLLNGCSKKQEAKQKVETEEIEKTPAPADTTTPPPPPAGEEATEEAPQTEVK